jgi:Pretoxin HINT domain/Protein of unknown function (DUF3990)
MVKCVEHIDNEGSNVTLISFFSRVTSQLFSNCNFRRNRKKPYFSKSPRLPYRFLSWGVETVENRDMPGNLLAMAPMPEFLQSPFVFAAANDDATLNTWLPQREEPEPVDESRYTTNFWEPISLKDQSAQSVLGWSDLADNTLPEPELRFSVSVGSPSNSPVADVFEFSPSGLIDVDQPTTFNSPFPQPTVPSTPDAPWSDTGLVAFPDVTSDAPGDGSTSPLSTNDDSSSPTTNSSQSSSPFQIGGMYANSGGGTGVGGGGPGQSNGNTWITSDVEKVYLGDQVTFFLDSSLTPAPTYSLVEWDFSYDNLNFTVDATGEVPYASNTFTSLGNKTVAARYTSDTTTSTVTYNVVVHNPPPVITTPTNTTAVEGYVDLVSITAVPQGIATITDITWWVSYEGLDYERIDAFQGLAAGPYYYELYGNYDFWVEVKDSNNEIAEAGFTITATNEAPNGYATYRGVYDNTLGVANAPVNEGNVVRFTVTELDRELNLDYTDSLTVTADFLGTGKYDLINDEDWYLDRETKTVRFDFLYDNNKPGGGKYPATVRVQDDLGNYTEDLVQVDIVNVVPAGKLDFGFRVASKASSGEDVWGIRDREMITMKPLINEIDVINPEGNLPKSSAFDPSQSDVESLKFWWTVDGEPVKKKLHDGTIVDYNDASIALPYADGKTDYEAGEKNLVKVYIEDQDGAKSPLETFYVVVFPFDLPAPPVAHEGTQKHEYTAELNQMGEEWQLGHVPFTNKLYGTFLKTGSDTPERYNVYSQFPSQKFDIPVNQPFDSKFTFTAESESVKNQIAPSIQYDFSISIYDTSGAYPNRIEVINHRLNSPSYTLPGQPVNRLVSITVVATNPAGMPTADPKANNLTPYYQIQVETPRESTVPEVEPDLWQMVRTLGGQFGSSIQQIFMSAAFNGPQILNTLFSGFTNAFTRFINDFAKVASGNILESNASKAFFRWLIGGEDKVLNLAGVDFSNLNHVKSVLLQFAGITWDHVQDVLVMEVGAGKVAAITQLYSTLFGDEPEISGAESLTKFVNDKLNLGQEVIEKIFNSAIKEIGNTAVEALPQIISMFIPGAGAVRGVYNTLMWVLNNQQKLGAVFTSVVQALDDLGNNRPANFENKLYQALNEAVDALIPLIAKQFGLDKLPTTLRKVVNFVPDAVDKKMRDVIHSALAPLLATTSGKYNSSRLTPLDYTFTRASTTDNYEMTIVEAGAANDSKSGKASIIQLKIDNVGDAEVAHVFIAADFNAGTEKTLFDAVITAGTNLKNKMVAVDRVKSTKEIKKPGKTNPQPKGVARELKVLQVALQEKMEALKTHLKDFGCKYLNLGCFVAGTKLWTPGGYRSIETLLPGDLVYSRDEWNPSAAVEAKVVEEVFTRFAGILHVHLGGQVIGTSGEHPFYVEGRGWVPAGELQPGESVLCADGSRVLVEEVYDTGEWQPVYNLRVADHHTYFIGEESWGWNAWVHNAYYYHGTSDLYAQNIVTSGVNLNMARLKQDFGKGFYTTTDVNQAARWANQNFPGHAAIVKFSVSDSQFASLTLLAFAGATIDWKNTVWAGRRGILDTDPLNADVVTGPFLKNPGAMKESAASAVDAEGRGDQQAWLTNSALTVLQKVKPWIFRN